MGKGSARCSLKIPPNQNISQGNNCVHGLALIGEENQYEGQSNLDPFWSNLISK